MNTYLLTQLVLALLSGIVLRNLRSKSGASMNAEAQRVVARLAWVLLAVFSVEAMSRGSMNFLYAVFMLFYIVIVYLLARSFATRTTETFQPIPVAATTFGGGNRGVAMISALSSLPLLAPNREALLAIFVQLDAAVIIWLVAVVPFLVRDTSTEKPQIIDSYKTFVSEAGYAPVIMVLVVLFGSLVPPSAKTSLQEFLAHSSRERAAVLTYLAFTLMFATTSLATRSIGDLLDDLWRFYVPRLLVPVLLVVLLYAGHLPLATLGASAVSLAIALSVLALSPPSSLFPVLLATSSRQSHHAERLADLNVLTTLLFLLFAMAAASPGPLLDVLRYVMNQ